MFGGVERTYTKKTYKNRGSDLEYTISITLKEGATGTEKYINVSRYDKCETCDGTGSKSKTKKTTCPVCHGTGQVVSKQGFITFSHTCSKCRGEGEIISDPCVNCRGTGRVKNMHKILVKIPAGIETGSSLRLRGEGDIGPYGGVRGDLYVTVYIEKDKFFTREGDDVICEVPITLTQAILGDEIEIPTLTGKVKMKIPPGTQNSSLFRLRNLGFPRVYGHGKGDQIVRIKVVMPQKLSKKLKSLFEEIKLSESIDNYPEIKKFLEEMKNN